MNLSLTRHSWVKITAEEIQGWKDLSIVAFEVAVWEHLGKDYCSPTDRRLSLDWDTGKTHHYYQCHVASDGSYTFKVHFTTLQLLYFVFAYIPMLHVYFCVEAILLQVSILCLLHIVAW